MKEMNHYLKIVGERFSFRIEPKSLVIARQENGIVWYTFKRINKRGDTSIIEAPASAIAFVEAGYGGIQETETE